MQEMLQWVIGKDRILFLYTASTFMQENARLSASLMFSSFSLDSNQGAEEGQNGWTAAKGRCLCRNSSIVSVAHCLHLSLRLCESLYLHSVGVMIALLHLKIYDKWMAMYMTIWCQVNNFHDGEVPSIHSTCFSKQVNTPNRIHHSAQSHDSFIYYWESPVPLSPYKTAL